MDPDADSQLPLPADRARRHPSVQDDALSWLRAPLSMRQLCALGILVVGGGIPAAVLVGGWAWLGLGLMVVLILAMAMAHEGGWTRKRHRSANRALRRTRGRRRPGGSRAKSAPRMRAGRGGGSGGREIEGTPDPRALSPADNMQPHPTPALEAQDVVEGVSLVETEKPDRP